MIGLPQLGMGQPYTMCHALRLVDRRVDCGKLATPAFGSNYGMDRPDVLIRLCLIAPARVQRAARAAGVKDVIAIRAPGLLEALERSRAGYQDSQGVVLPPKARSRTREKSDGS